MDQTAADLGAHPCRWKWQDEVNPVPRTPSDRCGISPESQATLPKSPGFLHVLVLRFGEEKAFLSNLRYCEQTV